MQAAPDEDALALALARQQRRTLASADTDFGTLLARTGAAAPSIILLRRATPRRAEQLAALLLANLDQLMEDLVAGAVVVVTDVDLRVRRLPIPPG
jgi:predicted nuclease of predicted toxin-antitoxin system